MIILKRVMAYRCDRCKNEWLPRKIGARLPTVCPSCKSPYWNKLRKDQMIEIYEWKAGETRPGSDRKPRHDCIGVVAVPTEGQVPQKGDVIHLHMPHEPVGGLGHDGLGMGIVRFVVLERELMWSIQKNPDDEPYAWSKMWIHVRRIEDYTIQASQVDEVRP